MKRRSTERIFLTGSSGTLGHHILAQLQKRPRCQILAVHRRSISHAAAHPQVRHEVIDFSRKRALAALFRAFQPTSIIHCAADGMIFPQVTWFKLVRFNVDFTLQLFELAARQASACHFIHISTGLVYRPTGAALRETDPIDNLHPYGASKGAADLLLRSAAVEFGLPLTVFRPFSFTGLWDKKARLFPSLLQAAMEKQPLSLSPCHQIRDFCSARDIGRAILLALDQPGSVTSPSIYNLGSGRSVELSHLIREIIGELQIPLDLRFGDRPCGPFEPMHLVADISRARKELGWQPEHRLAHAVWELARASFPTLPLKRPKELL